MQLLKCDRCGKIEPGHITEPRKVEHRNGWGDSSYWTTAVISIRGWERVTPKAGSVASLLCDTCVSRLLEWLRGDGNAG